MLQHNHKCSLCQTTESSIPMLKGQTTTHCLKCILTRSSKQYQIVSFLSNSIQKICSTHKQIISYSGRFQLTTQDSCGIGFCVLNKYFKQDYSYWPMESLNIEINGQTLWCKRSSSYYVCQDITHENDKRFIDLKITMEQFPNQVYILAVFQIKKISIPNLILKDLNFIIDKSRYFINQQYQNYKIDISQTKPSLQFSLRCPVSWNLIKIPVKFKQCQHYQPIDYKSIALISDHCNNSIRCPYCHKQTSFQNLIIDQYQYNIASNEVPNIQNLPEILKTQNMYIYNFCPPCDYTIGKIPERNQFTL